MKTKVTITEQRKIMIDILSYIDRICRENDIDYSLYAGTLLGAIRHQGFIPWDDDIDILLPRKSYEKLLAILKKDDCDYLLLDYNTPNYRYPFAKLCSRETYQNSPMREVDEYGIFVDIFPYDNLPNDPFEREQFIRTAWSMSENAVKGNFYTYSASKYWIGSLIKKVVFFPRFLKLRMQKDTYSRLKELDDFMKKYQNSETEFMGFVPWPYETGTEINESSYFKEFEKYKFEGNYYQGVKNYDGYLTKLYGNYMELPPEKDRENHSYYTWYWK